MGAEERIAYLLLLLIIGIIAIHCLLFLISKYLIILNMR